MNQGEQRPRSKQSRDRIKGYGALLLSIGYEDQIRHQNKTFVHAKETKFEW